ncbi:MAG TPA: hypothetical protein VHB21_20345 [Minicystis sp.]|nr:hypothetical protein [Minicystis sp.]
MKHEVDERCEDQAAEEWGALATTELPSPPFVAEVVTAQHPTLVGRVLVRWELARGGTCERWLPALQGLAVRAADRVLVTKPSNWAEPIVTGVVDGFARRPELERGGPTVPLLPDERLRVVDARGTALVDVVPTPDGPVVRIANPEVALELEGELRVSARAIHLVARDGEAKITAAEDVVVRGETIHLN